MDFNDRELVNNTDVMKLVSRVCYLGEDERKRVFNIPFVRDKLIHERAHHAKHRAGHGWREGGGRPAGRLRSARRRIRHGHRLPAALRGRSWRETAGALRPMRMRLKGACRP